MSSGFIPMPFPYVLQGFGGLQMKFENGYVVTMSTNPETKFSSEDVDKHHVVYKGCYVSVYLDDDTPIANHQELDIMERMNYQSTKKEKEAAMFIGISASKYVEILNFVSKINVH